MTTEVLGALRPGPGNCHADGTVGGGGHSEALLQASAPSGRLFGCDLDQSALEAARRRLAPFAGRFEIRQGDFAELDGWIAAESCDGVVMDLGVSSVQLDWPERGFSFQSDGPLDMRMDTGQELTAEAVVNGSSEEELARIFWEFGGEARGRRIAWAIVREREKRPLRRTQQLAELIEKFAPRGGKRIHPATKVFQALRMVVNDETGRLQRGLEAAVKILKPGGRLAVICFHSVEDRVVKKFGDRLALDYEAVEPDIPELRRPRPPVLRWAARKAIVPGPDELRDNPRSRSARCRVMQKI